MKIQRTLGWTRDSKGKVIRRTAQTYSNTVTQFSGGGYNDNNDTGNRDMRKAILTREGKIVDREGYSTALSTRYYAYAGYDNHAQHTLIMEIDEDLRSHTDTEQR